MKMIVKTLLPEVELTNTQLNILEDVLAHTKRLLILAPPKWGKSYISAISGLLFAILNDNVEVVIMSNNSKQSKMVMGYIKNLIERSPLISQQYIKEHFSVPRPEFSDDKIVFKNNSKIIAAHIHDKLWKNVLYNADLLIVDESVIIDDYKYRNYVMRTVKKDGIILENGTPIMKNHFFNTYNDEDYKVYEIDYKLAVQEGRLSLKDVEKMKSLLSNTEFVKMYEVKFVDDEDALYSHESIKKAYKDYNNFKVPYKESVKMVIGVDVARFGDDSTVITVLAYSPHKDKYYIRRIKQLTKKELSSVVSNVSYIYTNYSKENMYKIVVDANGVGAGVVDMLRERGYDNVEEFYAMAKPFNKEKYENIKTEMAFILKKLLDDGKILIPKDSALIDDLINIRYDYNKYGQYRVIDREDKSPDYFDSLLIALYGFKNLLNLNENDIS